MAIVLCQNDQRHSRCPAEETAGVSARPQQELDDLDLVVLHGTHQTGVLQVGSLRVSALPEQKSHHVGVMLDDRQMKSTGYGGVDVNALGKELKKTLLIAFAYRRFHQQDPFIGAVCSVFAQQVGDFFHAIGHAGDLHLVEAERPGGPAVGIAL